MRSAVRPSEIALRDLDVSCLEDVFDAYSLLQEAMGTESVEDLGSFRRMISPLTDPCVVPRVVLAFDDSAMVGVIVGATLKDLGAGFIAYSGVKEASRRRGIYATMRRDLVRRFTHDDRVGYVVSELDEQDWLFQKYVGDWNAVALPGYYEQPQVQGLVSKALRLVAQPVEGGNTPDPSETVALVKEIYERIYRIANVDGNRSYLKVLASLKGVGSRASDESNGSKYD